MSSVDGWVEVELVARVRVSGAVEVVGAEGAESLPPKNLDLLAILAAGPGFRSDTRPGIPGGERQSRWQSLTHLSTYRGESSRQPRPLHGAQEGGSGGPPVNHTGQQQTREETDEQP
jgi:hypothetical protein